VYHEHTDGVDGNIEANWVWLNVPANGWIEASEVVLVQACGPVTFAYRESLANSPQIASRSLTPGDATARHNWEISLCFHSDPVPLASWDKVGTCQFGLS